MFNFKKENKSKDEKMYEDVKEKFSRMNLERDKIMKAPKESRKKKLSDVKKERLLPNSNKEYQIQSDPIPKEIEFNQKEQDEIIRQIEEDTENN